MKKMYDKGCLEVERSFSSCISNGQWVTTSGRNDSVYTCPEILDSHHSSLRYNSGQIAISMHCNLQYS